MCRNTFRVLKILLILGSGACAHQPVRSAKAAAISADVLHDSELSQAVPKGHLTATSLLVWDELMTAVSNQFQANPELPIDDIQITPDRLASLPYPIRSNDLLARLTLSRSLQEPMPYDLGILGKVGSAKVFVAPVDRIRDYERLYWVMVKVLSEKYGCFMVSRIKRGDESRITCRDKRQIVLKRSRGSDWIQFYSRQYDRDGYEIMVKKHKIIRLSDRRVI